MLRSKYSHGVQRSVSHSALTNKSDDACHDPADQQPDRLAGGRAGEEAPNGSGALIPQMMSPHATLSNAMEGPLFMTRVP